MATPEEEKEALKAMLFDGDPSAFHTEDPQEVEADSEDDTSDVVENNIEVEEQEEEVFDAKEEFLKLKEEMAQPQVVEPGLTAEQQNLIAMGTQIQQLQQQNMPLYNKMIKFAQDELAGVAQPKENPIRKKIEEFKAHIKTEKYGDSDVTPFIQMVEMLELQLQQNDSLIKNNNDTRQQLHQNMQAFDGYRTSAEEEKINKVADRQLLDLSKAEKDFGIKVENGSRGAKQLVALVQGGESVRDAFLLVTGKTEKDKVSKKDAGKPITTSNGKNVKPSKDNPEQKALRSHLFGDDKKQNGAGIVYLEN